MARQVGCVRDFAHHADLGLVIPQPRKDVGGVGDRNRNEGSGLVVAEPGQCVRDMVHAVRCDPEPGFRHGTAFAQVGADLVLDLEEARGQAEQRLAGFGQPDLPPVAVEQQDVMGLLKPPHLVAEHGLGLAHHLRRPREAIVERDMVKGAQMGVSHGYHIENL